MGSSIPLVKREMRNLCILRIVHGFCQGLPLLFVQGFLIATHSPYISEVHKVSLSLSFFGICWSLASFNKNVRAKDIDKLVLTWIGVIFQLLWRLGTVSSRVIALVVYASAFEHWIILVVALHWLCMFLWLLVQNQDSGVLGKTKAAKFLWSFLISYLHNIAYINVEKNANTRLKIAAFYTVTLVENILLVSLWTTSVRASLDFESDERRDVVMTVVLAFLGGLFFMLLYYRLFHTSKISTAFKPGDGDDTSGAEDVAESGFGTKNSRPGGRNGAINSPEKMAMAEYCNNQAVFNCVLNPALRKKKKKMPSVVPPPPSAAEAAAMAANKATKAETPFWKQPLPDQQSEIRLKLQNKHENQLRQLQLIENEIRAGHIKRPNLVQNGFSFQPPPIIQRDPGAVHSYLNIHDPLNDSSGDQGNYVIPTCFVTIPVRTNIKAISRTSKTMQTSVHSFCIK